MGDGGKGSAQRPIANRKTFEENWDAIFGDDSSSRNVDSGGVSSGESIRDCGGAQHGDQRDSKDKPAKPGT